MFYIFIDIQIIFQVKKLLYKRPMLARPKNHPGWSTGLPLHLGGQWVGQAPVSNPLQSQSFLPHSYGAFPLKSRPLSWNQGFPMSNSIATVFHTELLWKEAILQVIWCKTKVLSPSLTNLWNLLTSVVLVQTASIIPCGSLHSPATTNSEDILSPVAFWFWELSWCRGLIPGQGTCNNQAMNAWMSGTTNQGLSICQSIYLSIYLSQINW